MKFFHIGFFDENVRNNLKGISPFFSKTFFKKIQKKIRTYVKFMSTVLNIMLVISKRNQFETILFYKQFVKHNYSIVFSNLPFRQ